MKKFNIECINGDTLTVTTNSAREAARIARRQGKDIMKHNKQSTTYCIWDENEENLFYTVRTYKVGNRTVSKIDNESKHSK